MSDNQKREKNSSCPAFYVFANIYAYSSVSQQLIMRCKITYADSVHVPNKIVAPYHNTINVSKICRVRCLRRSKLIQIISSIE